MSGSVIQGINEIINYQIVYIYLSIHPVIDQERTGFNSNVLSNVNLPPAWSSIGCFNLWPRFKKTA